MLLVAAYQKAMCNASMFKAFHFNGYKSFSMCSAHLSVFGNAYENLPLRLNRLPLVCFKILLIECFVMAAEADLIEG